MPVWILGPITGSLRIAPIGIAFVCYFLLSAVTPSVTLAQEFTPGGYYWYTPEHEWHSRTLFYTQPSFDSRTVRIPRTQRFKYSPGRRGWVVLEFDVAGKAYIHLRVLRILLYNPAAGDALYEFQRASVFPEEPAKIEARLKAPVAPAPAVVDSKVPAYKRYKESWGIKTGRPAQPATEGEPSIDSAHPSSRPLPGTATGKPRTKYPLLPPIGSVPQQEEPNPEGVPSTTDTEPSR